MSAATAFEMKPYLVQWTRELGSLYVKDLKALPEGTWSASFAGKARTPQDFTAEVVGFCDFMAAACRGESRERRTEEERNAFRDSLATPDDGAKAIETSVNALADAFDAAPVERLAEMFESPIGTMPLFVTVNIAINHVLYHDAQLNYIQALHGDGEMHWF